ncbi:MAG: GNAT family N-acyltransferase, partial [Hyphomicrobiaceae bacterium]
MRMDARSLMNRWKRRDAPGARRVDGRLLSFPGWPIGIPQRRPAKTYGRIGDLEVRLARNRVDIKLAQRLRYDVFYGEMSAKPSMTMAMRRRDEDRYDGVCDHLLVFDTAPVGDSSQPWPRLRGPRVIGTYRV